jgi:predicted ATPase
VVFATGGDGFAVAFGRAGDAVAAAVDGQISLRQLTRPVAIRVRMGIHTREAVERDGEYFGPAVNRTARLMAAGHGGQVLCSGVTAAIVTESLPDGCGLVDLGVHRLRDLSVPERIHQVVIEGLSERFPPLRSLDAFPGNLPVQPTAFVGRDREVAEVSACVLEARVVTLTGVGGVGKTRLALQVAAELLPRFRDGAWLVELAGVVSPEGVPEAAASALGLGSGPTVAPGLLEYLGSRELLLILDNCEHLLAPVASLVEKVVRAAPRVRVLATSREGVGVAGEHVRTVPSLQLPDASAGPSQIAACDGVRLFVERAGEASASYRFTDGDAAAVADLCRRLDGIPLAIELAAARVPALTPAEIAEHLDQRFKLLSAGRRAAVARHQTLRNAIEWSYQLLEPHEQTVLDRLAVFAGGFDLSAAQAVAAADTADAFDVLDIMIGLVAKSLVVAEAGGSTTRYRLLETMRDFGWEHLQARGDSAAVARRHAEYLAEFARNAGAGLRGPQEAQWRQRVEREMANLRAALAWAVAAGDIRLALEPVSDLAVFGDGVAPYGLLAESAARLAEDHPQAPIALGAACVAAVLQGQIEAAWPLAKEARARAATLERSPEGLWVRCLVASATSVTMAYDPAGLEDYNQYGEQWLHDARELGDPWSLNAALTFMTALAGVGNTDKAIAAGEEALDLARHLAPSRVAIAAVILAANVAPGDPLRSEELLQEAAAAAKLAGNDWVDYVTSLYSIRLHVGTGNLKAAAETAAVAIERSRARKLSGHTIQFVTLLACVMANLPSTEGALLLAAWVDQHGVAIKDDNPFLATCGGTHLIALRAQQSAIDLERIARMANSLDESAVAQFAKEHLVHLSPLAPETTIS